MQLHSALRSIRFSRHFRLRHCKNVLEAYYLFCFFINFKMTCHNFKVHLYLFLSTPTCGVRGAKRLNICAFNSVKYCKCAKSHFTTTSRSKVKGGGIYGTHCCVTHNLLFPGGTLTGFDLFRLPRLQPVMGTKHFILS